ncbi:MAG: phenylalanine--tRNA ligase beta subunit-related protein, partial [Patescibacteria group bacterium]
MFISLNWLREFVDLPKNVKADELARLITVRSAEVEKVLDPTQSFAHMVLGHVKSLEQHPNADRLRVAQVDIGKKDLVQVVCGGVNLENGMKVPVALPGAIVKWHGNEIVEMKDSEIRGISSHGMICAGEEIGLEPGAEKEILNLSHLKAKAGTPLAEALGIADVVLEFDNKALTHRPDLWGHRGMAREIAAITGAKFVDKKPALKIPAKGKSPDVKVENVELCPRYMAVIIRGVKVAPSPEWMKQRLLATDHSVISNIVDVSNYIMEEIGQPLHTFDLKKIKGGIVVRHAKKGEELTTLDGIKHKLDPEML